MDFATEKFFPPGANFGGRNHFFHRLQSSGPNLSKIDKTGTAKLQRLEYFFLTEAIKCITGKYLDNFTEHNEPEIAINGPSSRRGVGSFSVNLLVDVILRCTARDKVDSFRSFHSL